MKFFKRTCSLKCTCYASLQFLPVLSIKNSFLWWKCTGRCQNSNARLKAGFPSGMSSFPWACVFSEKHIWICLSFIFLSSRSLSIFKRTTYIAQPLRNLCGYARKRGGLVCRRVNRARSLICWRRYYQFRWGRSVRSFGKTAFDLAHPVDT